MKWKIFLTSCFSAFLISFPYNIIGCGPDIDPYDYYTSFFNPDVSSNEALRPFYYTGYNFIYNSTEPVDPSDVLAKEWKTYCGNDVTEKDAKTFVTEYAKDDILNLYYHLEKNKPLQIPDSVKRNSMTKYFFAQKDFEALGYIIYAKKIEPLVSNNSYRWDVPKRDNAEMAKGEKNGLQLYKAAKKDLFKLKYAYQITKLAHYAGNYDNAIKYYDDYILNNKTETVLQALALSLKAGALYRKGNKTEAAYLFSKSFSEADAKKISNFISFNWAVDNSIKEDTYLKLCKTDEEKANMMALFALSSGVDATQKIEAIYKLNPSNKHIEALLAREINKLESSYFTPLLNKQKGGKLFYYTWVDIPTDSLITAGAKEVQALNKLLLQIASGSNANTNFCYTTAAYCALMLKDFKQSNVYLNKVNKANMSANLKDQWMLTNLLLTINESKKLDAAAEEKILPSLKWLQQKALNDKVAETDWSSKSPWKVFYRNIMTEALAKKYHAQRDIHKEALCVGAADKIFKAENNYYTKEFLRNDMDVKDVEKLYDFILSKSLSSYENFLVKNSALTTPMAVDFLGTAYLRNYDYDNAIKWFNSAGASKKDTIFKSAFIELLGDTEERLSTEKRSTSKLLFAQEMKETQALSMSDKKNEAKHLYKMATGMYNMTYYGHAWELVQYYRSGSDGYTIPKDATEFQKQYYGCYAAHDMFKKALEAATDRNFKAKCLFMMAKCSQKTAARRYGYLEPNYTYEQAQEEEKKFWPLFKNNKYFPTLVKEYRDTKFYEEAYNSCSYLRDFEEKMK
jgi:hypothetical protein